MYQMDVQARLKIDLGKPKILIARLETEIIFDSSFLCLSSNKNVYFLGMVTC